MVEKFINDALDNLALRLYDRAVRAAVSAKEDVVPLCTSVPPEPRPTEQILSELNKLLGLENLRQQLKKLVHRITFERRFAEQEQVPVQKPTLHSLFLGSPGTGETTVARLMGELFRNLGLLPRGHVVVVSDRSELIGKYLGQTVPTVKKGERSDRRCSFYR